MLDIHKKFLLNLNNQIDIQIVDCLNDDSFHDKCNCAVSPIKLL